MNVFIIKERRKSFPTEVSIAYFLKEEEAAEFCKLCNASFKDTATTLRVIVRKIEAIIDNIWENNPEKIFMNLLNYFYEHLEKLRGGKVYERY